MKNTFTVWGPWRWWRWFIPITGFVLLFCAYCLLRGGKKPAPVVPVVSNCKKLGPGMRRIGRFEFQFDVPVEGFTIKDFASDAPSGAYGFDVKPSGSASFLEISWDPKMGMEGMSPAVDPVLNFSGPIENRKIVDDEGNPVGEDSWGYWDHGELWRRVRFRGSIVARYGAINPGDVATHGSVHREDAEIFDKVINSVCFEPYHSDAKYEMGVGLACRVPHPLFF